LQWAKIQQGKIAFKPVKIKLYELIVGVADFLKANMEEKNISLEIDVNKEMVIVADISMLQAIIRNLLSNALKYTPQLGKISIKASASTKNIIIEISDTGVGMTPKDLKKLFKIDTSFSKVGTNNETGTGLGLILCHEFVEKHQGEILVKSKTNKGTSFSVILPK
jgi:signal transduction histidine kinase